MASQYSRRDKNGIRLAGMAESAFGNISFSHCSSENLHLVFSQKLLRSSLVENAELRRGEIPQRRDHSVHFHI